MSWDILYPKFSKFELLPFTRSLLNSFTVLRRAEMSEPNLIDDYKSLHSYMITEFFRIKHSSAPEWWQMIRNPAVSGQPGQIVSGIQWNKNSWIKTAEKKLKVVEFFFINRPRRLYWWGGFVNIFWHVTAFNRSDYNIDQLNCRTVVTCQNKFTTPPRTSTDVYSFQSIFCMLIMT